MMKTFYVGVKGVIVKDGKALILRNSTKFGRADIWDVPGGRIDDDESIEQTLNRELKEELPNIKNVRVGSLLNAYRLHKDIDGDKSLVLVFFKVEADFNGDPELSDEHIDLQWVTEAEAIATVSESCVEAIQRALS